MYIFRHMYVTRPTPMWLPGELTMVHVDGGLVEIGHNDEGFSFDNESPRHIENIEGFRVGDRLVTAGEWLEFIKAGGYANPVLTIIALSLRLADHLKKQIR